VQSFDGSVLHVAMQSRPMSAGTMSSVGGAAGSGYHQGHHHHHHHHHHQTDDAQSSRSGDTPGPHSHSNLNSYPNCDHNSDGGMSAFHCVSHILSPCVQILYLYTQRFISCMVLEYRRVPLQACR